MVIKIVATQAISQFLFIYFIYCVLVCGNVSVT